MKFILPVFAMFILIACHQSLDNVPHDLTREHQQAAGDCSKSANLLPNSNLKGGQSDPNIPIDHILVIMQENHSFDSYLGSLSFKRNNVDGINPSFFNLNTQGEKVYVYHEKNLCVADVDHSWDAMHESWNQGSNDQFVKLNDSRTMGYYTKDELPFYYQLADEYAIADRYFASSMTQTNPNRYYLFAATSFGQIDNSDPTNDQEFAQKTIFDVLNDYNISWKYYTDGQGYLQYFKPLIRRNQNKLKKILDYQNDLKTGNLPQVVFIDAVWDTEDEHARANIQKGQLWVANRIFELQKSRFWKNSVLFLTYDESGDYYDHVSPPKACAPDSILPKLGPDNYLGGFDQYGFRVPFFAVSPFAKKSYVSHQVYDHTSILNFIETKFNLPSLTRRDANSNSLMDLFDFKSPANLSSKLKNPNVDGNAGCD